MPALFVLYHKSIKLNIRSLKVLGAHWFRRDIDRPESMSSFVWEPRKKTIIQ